MSNSFTRRAAVMCSVFFYQDGDHCKNIQSMNVNGACTCRVWQCENDDLWKFSMQRRHWIRVEYMGRRRLCFDIGVLLTSCPDPYTAASHIQLRAAVRSDQQNYCETSARSLSSTRCRRASISLLFGGAVLRGGVGADITPSIVAWRRASPLAESWCNVWQPVLMP